MRLTTKLTWPVIFAVIIKTQLCGYFYGNVKNPAILLTLLVLASSHPQFSEKITAISVYYKTLIKPRPRPNLPLPQNKENGEKSTIPNYSTPPFSD